MQPPFAVRSHVKAETLKFIFRVCFPVNAPGAERSGDQQTVEGRAASAAPVTAQDGPINGSVRGYVQVPPSRSFIFVTCGGETVKVKSWKQFVVGLFGFFAHPVLTAELSTIILLLIVILIIICMLSACSPV